METPEPPPPRRKPAVGDGKREPKSRAARLALTGRSSRDEARSASGARSVRAAALARLGGSAKPASNMLVRIAMLAMGALLLFGVSMYVVNHGDREAADELFRPSVSGQFNFPVLKADTTRDPGVLILVAQIEGGGTMELGGDRDASLPVQVPVLISADGAGDGASANPIEGEIPPPFSERLAQQLARESGELTQSLMEQAKQIDALSKQPLFKLPVRIREDIWGVSGPSNTHEEHLKREVYRAERVPVPGADAKQGPWLFPPMMETPRIAFDRLLEDLAATSAEAIARADNGPSFVHFDQPHTVEAARGHVVTVEGRLWMLREQPLRRPVNFNGREVSVAYFGVIALIRDGLGHERPKVHDAVAFTTLKLPPDLLKHAIKAGEFPSNSDSLAREVVGAKVTGAWFRRIALIEPVAELVVEMPQPKDPGVPLEDKNQKYFTEAYLPWVVGQTATITPYKLPSVAESRALATMYAESNTPIRAAAKDIFDEAGYYALLAAVAAPASDLEAMPAASLTFRQLASPSERDKYRGAKAKVSGFLLDTYHPLVFPPNISGRRHAYRTIVADADRHEDARTELTWYVDVLEPPYEFRGSPRVMVDGWYCRSQTFRAEVEKRSVVLTLPLVVAKSIDSWRSPSGDPESEEIGTIHIAVILGSALAVIALVIWLSKRTRRQEAEWRREAIAKAAGPKTS